MKYARVIRMIEQVAGIDEENARAAEHHGDKPEARRLTAEALLLREAAGILGQDNTGRKPT
jgi:hypothetical protein